MESGLHLNLVIRLEKGKSISIHADYTLLNNFNLRSKEIL